MDAIARQRVNCVRRGDVLLLTASEREYETLRLLAAGLNIDDIARAMGIHRSTANTYISRWSQRTGAHNKAMLAVWAIVTGLVTQAEIWDIWETYAPQLREWKP